MRKSEHSKLQILSRLAEYASVHGLWALTFGTAAATAYVSKGGLQRYFANKEAMQLAVLEHVAATLDETVFKPGSTPDTAREAWFRWLDGRGLLSGGCVLTATAAVVGISAQLEEHELPPPNHRRDSIGRAPVGRTVGKILYGR